MRKERDVYIGETGRTLQKHIYEHTGAVKRQDSIAMHIWNMNHGIDWDAAEVRAIAPFYWERRMIKAILIHQERSTLNLECGLQLNDIWHHLLIVSVLGSLQLTYHHNYNILLLCTSH